VVAKDSITIKILSGWVCCSFLINGSCVPGVRPTQVAGDPAMPGGKRRGFRPFTSLANQVSECKSPGRDRHNSQNVVLVKSAQQANHAGRLNKPLGPQSTPKMIYTFILLYRKPEHLDFRRCND
jgi:hypothetical protein